MIARSGLRWAPWPVEAGASRALAPCGQSYIARPKGGGGFALYHCGLHVGNYGSATDYKAAAERIETLKAQKRSTE